MPWSKVPASTVSPMDVSLMNAPRPHRTNEQPLRESDRSETKAKQTSRGRLVVYIYYPQKIPPPEAADRSARDAPPSVVTDLAARSRSPLEVPRRPSSSRCISEDQFGL